MKEEQYGQHGLVNVAVADPLVEEEAWVPNHRVQGVLPHDVVQLVCVQVLVHQLVAELAEVSDTGARGASWQGPRGAEEAHGVIAAVGQVQAATAAVQANGREAVILWHRGGQVDGREGRPGEGGQTLDDTDWGVCEKQSESQYRYQAVLFSWVGETGRQPGPVYSELSCPHFTAWRAKCRLSSSLRSEVTLGHSACFYPWVSPPVALLRLAFCPGLTLLQVLLLWQEKKWTPHTHTHTHTHTHSLTPIQQECAWKQNPEAACCLSLFFPCTFFSLVGVHRDGGREQTGTEGGSRGWGYHAIGKKASLAHVLGPPLLLFS